MQHKKVSAFLIYRFQYSSVILRAPAPYVWPSLCITKLVSVEAKSIPVACLDCSCYPVSIRIPFNWKLFLLLIFFKFLTKSLPQPKFPILRDLLLRYLRAKYSGEYSNLRDKTWETENYILKTFLIWHVRVIRRMSRTCSRYVTVRNLYGVLI